MDGCICHAAEQPVSRRGSLVAGAAGASLNAADAAKWTRRTQQRLTTVLAAYGDLPTRARRMKFILLRSQSRWRGEQKDLHSSGDVQKRGLPAGLCI